MIALLVVAIVGLARPCIAVVLSEQSLEAPEEVMADGVDGPANPPTLGQDLAAGVLKTGRVVGTVTVSNLPDDKRSCAACGESGSEPPAPHQYIERFATDEEAAASETSADGLPE